MKRHNDISLLQIARLLTGVIALCLALASVPPLDAQAADTFATSLAVPARGAAGKPGKGVEPIPVDDKPSRYAGQDIKPYTVSRAAAFSMKSRITDPFGLNQDPTVPPAVKKVVTSDPSRRQAALPPTPLSDIVKLIRVTTIMPGEKKFLVGVRSFAESDEFSLNFQGKRMRMKIMEVTSRSILFRNLENGETASLETALLPAGMSAGGDKTRPPGMVSALDDVPLELGAGNAPATNN